MVPVPAPSCSSSSKHTLHNQSDDKPKIVSAYRWEDESNGEIYTDMPIDQGEEMKDLPLYVVENGQEFPLLPLSQRKTSFEFVPRLPSQQPNLTVATSGDPISSRHSTFSPAASSSTLDIESKVLKIQKVSEINFN